MQITNHADLPEAIVEAIRRDPYDPGDCDISVTRLIGPPQLRILERRHADEIEEDASDRIWALVGQIGHRILERAEAEALAETRLFAQAGGWTVSGQFDRMVLLPDGTLQDYKFTSVWACVMEPSIDAASSSARARSASPTLSSTSTGFSVRKRNPRMRSESSSARPTSRMGVP